MQYPYIRVFRNVLYVVLVLQIVFGGILFFSVQDEDFFDVIQITFALGVSIFYVVLLITLINYVTYLDSTVSQLKNTIYQLENKLKPSSNPTAGRRSPARADGGSLGDRLGKL